MDDLKIEKAILVGMSLGGMVAVKFAISHAQRVDRIILVSGISIEGFPPFMQKDPVTQAQERL